MERCKGKSLYEHLRDEQENLTRFVKSVYKDASVRPRNIECVVRYGAPVSETVINYAIEQKASFICIGTRGAASVRKILGTHTSSIIKQSPIPVFAVPKNFTRIPIDHIMYASDLIDFRNEVKAVKAVASILNAKVSVLHYDYFLQIKEAKAEFRKIASRYGSSNIDFHLQKFDWEKSLADHIEKAIRKFKPSVVALFTKQNRNWYQRIFLSSKSADVTYDTKKPILVFPKA